MQVIHVEGTDMYELKSGYKDFDISLDQCSLRHPTRAVRCALCRAHAHRMLIGACNPMVVSKLGP